jgi:hypothetical protein
VNEEELTSDRSRSYVAALESRIDHLERRKRELLVRRASVTMEEAPVKVEEAESHTVSRLPPHGQGKVSKQKEATDIDDVISDLGFM